MSTQSQIEEQVITKAEEDAEFRAKLLKDPKAAIKDATGFTVPESINIHVLEDNPSDFHLVLPPAGRNLTSQEMSAVAGGIGDINTW
ncbi:MAG: NHLP leader peptide family natural product precursor [Gammaproteobacteria bacterium]|nr:NHLP leader peptide family RiPP precursor [Gammaproteobacteria bacterium]MDE0480408.1 NHLP leader peptide family RiPP precursor [Gammaproteobacteria bacterium]MDE0508476.1 NHLP leader peptide family RiPP precursor [Gammaproteobacteria bacterium]MXX06076.1 NHLP leader peptide family natural product precursor [Gammaproteobacteria bacterium]MXY91040.1 NHLP leader peptide family natural product precursor [Gammaproteobacteria bacterium]